MDEEVCRICGASVATWELRSASGGGGCTRCEGSPLCADCGHPRSEHFGVFGGSNRHGCKVKIRTFESLAVSRCECEGYVAASGPLAQAAFAAVEPLLADAVMPTLRIANPPHAD